MSSVSIGEISHIIQGRIEPLYAAIDRGALEPFIAGSVLGTLIGVATEMAYEAKIKTPHRLKDWLTATGFREHEIKVGLDRLGAMLAKETSSQHRRPKS